VPKDNYAINIVPTAMSTKIKSMTLNGNAIASKTGRIYPVADGTVLTLNIVAPDGVSTSTYKFTIVK
jgi:hypothetical protein